MQKQDDKPQHSLDMETKSTTNLNTVAAKDESKSFQSGHAISDKKANEGSIPDLSSALWLKKEHEDQPQHSVDIKTKRITPQNMVAAEDEKKSLHSGYAMSNENSSLDCEGSGTNGSSASLLEEEHKDQPKHSFDMKTRRITPQNMVAAEDEKKSLQCGYAMSNENSSLDCEGSGTNRSSASLLEEEHKDKPLHSYTHGRKSIRPQNVDAATNDLQDGHTIRYRGKKIDSEDSTPDPSSMPLLEQEDKDHIMMSSAKKPVLQCPSLLPFPFRHISEAEVSTANWWDDAWDHRVKLEANSPPAYKPSTAKDRSLEGDRSSRKVVATRKPLDIGRAKVPLGAADRVTEVVLNTMVARSSPSSKLLPLQDDRRSQASPIAAKVEQPSEVKGRKAPLNALDQATEVGEHSTSANGFSIDDDHLSQGVTLTEQLIDVRKAKVISNAGNKSDHEVTNITPADGSSSPDGPLPQDNHSTSSGKTEHPLESRETEHSLAGFRTEDSHNAIESIDRVHKWTTDLGNGPLTDSNPSSEEGRSKSGLITQGHFRGASRTQNIENESYFMHEMIERLDKEIESWGEGAPARTTWEPIVTFKPGANISPEQKKEGLKCLEKWCHRQESVSTEPFSLYYLPEHFEYNRLRLWVTYNLHMLKDSEWPQGYVPMTPKPSDGMGDDDNESILTLGTIDLS